MKENAIVIDFKDNVATALHPLGKKDPVRVEVDGETIEILLTQDIPVGHKFALQTIPQGQAVIKYGEAIGLTIQPILRGEHVHVHNVESRKGRGDRQ